MANIEIEAEKIRAEYGEDMHLVYRGSVTEIIDYFDIPDSSWKLAVVFRNGKKFIQYMSWDNVLDVRYASGGMVSPWTGHNGKTYAIVEGWHHKGDIAMTRDGTGVKLACFVRAVTKTASLWTVA